MNEQIKASSELQIDTAPFEKLVNVSDIHLNVSQKMIITTEDKVRLCLLEHLNQIGRKGSWIAPLGIFIAIVTTLVTSSFKEKVLLLSADTWRAIFVIMGVLSFAWLIYASIRALRSKKIDFVEELKKGSHFDTKQIEKIQTSKVVPEITKRKNDGEGESDIVSRRVGRILAILNARRRSGGASWTVSVGQSVNEYRVPSPSGNFEFYYVGSEQSIEYSLIISAHNQDFDFKSDLADIRVMLSQYQNTGNMNFKFVIATNLDLSEVKAEITEFFKIALQSKKEQKYFSLEVWDKIELLKIEKSLGLRI